MDDRPYARPRSSPSLSEIAKMREKSVLDALKFERQSTVEVFFLSLVSLGIYHPIWMYLKTERLREIWRESNLSPTPYAVLATIAAPLNIAMVFHFEPQTLLFCVYLVYSVVYTIYMFMLREALNEFLGGGSESPYWIDGAGTFFLGTLYMNYKLNRAIDYAYNLRAMQRVVQSTQAKGS